MAFREGLARRLGSSINALRGAPVDEIRGCAEGIGVVNSKIGEVPVGVAVDAVRGCLEQGLARAAHHHERGWWLPARRQDCFVVVLHVTLALITLRAPCTPNNILLPPRRAPRTRIDHSHGVKAVPPFPRKQLFP